MSAMTTSGELAAMCEASAGLRIPSSPETGRLLQGPYTKNPLSLIHGPGVAFSASARRTRRASVVRLSSVIVLSLGCSSGPARHRRTRAHTGPFRYRISMNAFMKAVACGATMALP